MAITAAELLVKVGYDDSAVKEGTKNTSKQLEEDKSVLAGKGKEIAMGGGLAMGAALAGGVWGAIANESSGDKLAAQLGINNPEFAADLGKVAGNLYANNYGDSMGTVNEALKGVWQQNLLPEDATNGDIEKVTSQVLTLSDTFGQDLAGTTAAVGQMLRNGLAPNAEAAMDILTRGFQQGADKSGDLLDTFNEYGTQFRELGLDGATATGLLQQGLKAGARDADTVADSLKEFAIRAQDGSKSSSDAFTALGLDAKNMMGAMARGGPEAAGALQQTLDKLRAMPDSTERTALAVALFGTKAEDMQDALYALDPSKATLGLGTLEGATNKLADTVGNNTAAKLETFKRQGLQALADVASKYVIPAIEGLMGAVGFLGDHMDIVVPVLIGLGVGIMAALIPALASWLAVQIPLAAAVIATNAPLIAIGVAIAALIAGVIYAYTHFQTFRDIVDSAMSVIKTIIETTINVVVAIIGWFVDTGKALWDTFGGAIMAVVQTAFGLVQTYIETVLGVVMGIWNIFAGIFTGDWGRVWDGIKGVVDSVWNGIKTAIEIAINAVWGTIQTVGGNIVSFFTGLPGKMLGIFDGMFDGISSAFKSAVNFVIRGWNGIEFSIPGFHIGPIGYDGFTIGTPDIPELAKGGDIIGGGWALTGEKGPELGFWPAGAQVRPLSSSLPMGGDTNVTNNIVVNMPPGSNGDDVVNALRKWQRTNGSLPIRVEAAQKVA